MEEEKISIEIAKLIKKIDLNWEKVMVKLLAMKRL